MNCQRHSQINEMLQINIELENQFPDTVIQELIFNTIDRPKGNLRPFPSISSCSRGKMSPAGWSSQRSSSSSRPSPASRSCPRRPHARALRTPQAPQSERKASAKRGLLGRLLGVGVWVLSFWGGWRTRDKRGRVGKVGTEGRCGLSENTIPTKYGEFP